MQKYISKEMKNPSFSKQEAYTHWWRECTLLLLQVNIEFLLFFIPLSFRGLQTSCFFCNATTVGCFGFHEPTAEGGLPLNLLLRAIGVASTCCGNGEDTLEVRQTLCGSQTKDWRPMARSGLSRAEGFGSGVDMLELDSGRKVAMEALLLGWKT